MDQPLFILTDIEGTTTPKDFVFKILFPYFQENLSEVIHNASKPSFQEGIKMVQATVLAEENRAIELEEVITYLAKWVKADRKHPGLKHLQGLVWENAYQSGQIKGQIYAEVPRQLTEWQESGIGLGIYSSGSVKAQQLLFEYSEYGDLTKYFIAYFDTKVGHKRAQEAYAKISEELGVDPEKILFLSDIAEELDAAAACGYATCQVVRDDTTIPSSKHKQIANFTELSWQ